MPVLTKTQKIKIGFNTLINWLTQNGYVVTDVTKGPAKLLSITDGKLTIIAHVRVSNLKNEFNEGSKELFWGWAVKKYDKPVVPCDLIICIALDLDLNAVYAITVKPNNIYPTFKRYHKVYKDVECAICMKHTVKSKDPEVFRLQQLCDNLLITPDPLNPPFMILNKYPYNSKIVLM